VAAKAPVVERFAFTTGRSVFVSAARSAAINRDFAQKRFAPRSVIATRFDFNPKNAIAFFGIKLL